MAGKPPEVGKLELTVKMDYSETYRENEKLDLDLDQHLVAIVRSQARFLNNKEDELEMAKVEAERSLRLKEAVAKRQESVDGLGFLTAAALARRRSSVALGSGRLSENNGEEGDGGAVHRSELKPSLTERRIAMERDLFSARRMFNVVRRHNNISYLIDTSAQKDTASDGVKTGLSVMTLSAPGRPHSHPSRGQGERRRGYLRPTTASASRLGRLTSGSSSSSDTDGYGRPQRRARSRMELEKMCRLNIDPFDDVSERGSRGWSPTGDPKQEMLQTLRTRSGQIQNRVTAFIRDLEDFNKRNRKSRLEHILETAR